MITVEDCTNAQFAEVAPRLREADQREWELTVGASPAELVQTGYLLPAGAGTINRRAVDENGQTLCVWGVSAAYPQSPDVGWVWLVATEDAVPRALGIHRHLKREMKRLTATWPNLITASWDGNVLHQEWLLWLGFTSNGFKLVVPSSRAILTPYRYDRRQ